VQANDTCIQCHSQGQPLTNPIKGKYYDWPVGFHMGKKARRFLEAGGPQSWASCRLPIFPMERRTRNRMQGNDFVQSLMYNAGRHLRQPAMIRTDPITMRC